MGFIHIPSIRVTDIQVTYRINSLGERAVDIDVTENMSAAYIQLSLGEARILSAKLIEALTEALREEQE